MVIEGTPFADAMQTDDELEALVENEIYAFTSLLCENKSHDERCKNCDDIVRYCIMFLPITSLVFCYNLNRTMIDFTH